MIRKDAQRLVEGRTLILVIAALMAASLFFARPAQADTFTVTNNRDDGLGSLRQAMEVANAVAGADTIEFDIPGSGVSTIAPTSPLPVITGPVTIDGYSQPGSRPNSRKTGANDAVILIELSGFNAGQQNGLRVTGLNIRASNVVVRGLAINRFSADGIEITEGTGNRIVGNYIGTDPTGVFDRGNAFDGVSITEGDKNTIGGVTPASRNLLSGNNETGAEIVLSEGNKVQGNLIGVQKDGSTIMGGSQVGVSLNQVDNTTVGGAEPEAANVIAFSLVAGVSVLGFSADTGNRVLSNSIFSNGEAGIDLLGQGDGRAQDPRDPDVGSNTQQNFPEITSAKKAASGTTTVKATLDSTPSTARKKKTFLIQLFANPQNNPLSFDEGKTLLGQKKVTTNRQGLVSFSFETNRQLAVGDRITATATSKGGTSEFSSPVVVALAPGQG
jgi:trimeric autotransporter adhesin